MTITLKLWMLIALAGAALFAAPFVFHRHERGGDYSFDVGGALWLMACWPSGAIVLFFAALEWWRT